MSLVPRSLCALDCCLYIQTDKSSLIHAIEKADSQVLQPIFQTQVQLSKVLIIDAMTVFQSIKKTSATQKLSHLQEAFIKRIVLMLIGYSEGWIVFDQHKEKSLKNKTRQKRSTTSTEYQVYPQMKLTISIKDLLSSSKTKSYLTTMFAGALLEHF